MFWYALIGLSWASPEVSDHTVIYYNARMALREDEPLEATKLWLLRNALEEHEGSVSPHDADFHSVTWAALGDMGVCPDGHPTDEEGAGLWPLALHNWVVRNRSRMSKPKRPKPFQTFEIGRQQRFISIGDVLSVEELETVRLYRWGCVRPRLALLAAGESVVARLSDRQVSARLLQYLLERARTTLVPERVRGLSTIDARLFDIHLQLTALAAREARRKASERARQGRVLGMSRASITAMRDDEPGYTFSADSEPARILLESLDWPASEWMSLSPERRLFLYDHAKEYTGAKETLDATGLEIIDHLVEDADGEEVEKWIAHRTSDDSSAIWGGARGQSLMALDRESGFKERSVIALHRGVNHLEQGDLSGSMRAFAYALRLSPESRVGEEVHSLGLRWLTYVASQFEITNELLVTLRQLVPRREYSLLLEDLMWGAAFRADIGSFERGITNQAGRGALERRIALLHPLAKGDVNGFSLRMKKGLSESPSETMRFLKQLVQRLELEDAAVRTAHLPTMERLSDQLEPLADPSSTGRQTRTAEALLQRIQAIRDGLGVSNPWESVVERARSLDPDSEVFAGAVRLAPSDPLPWPFRPSDVAAPSVFSAMKLVPEEWRDEDGEWVFGWSIRG